MTNKLYVLHLHILVQILRNIAQRSMDEISVYLHSNSIEPVDQSEMPLYKWSSACNEEYRHIACKRTTTTSTTEIKPNAPSRDMIDVLHFKTSSHNPLRTISRAQHSGSSATSHVKTERLPINGPYRATPQLATQKTTKLIISHSRRQAIRFAHRRERQDIP